MCVIARLMTNDGDNDDVVDDDDGDADDDGYGREIEEYYDDYGATDDAGDLTYLFSTVICHCLLPFVIGSSDWYMASAARLDATNCWHRVAASANAGTNSAHTPLPRDGAGGMRMRPTAASNLQGPLTSNTA